MTPLSLDFPKPLVPKSPVLGWASFSRSAPEAASHRGTAYPSVLALPHKRYVTSARIAIAIALQRLGVGAGDDVLVPAFHSFSMVEPVVHRGARPKFYALDRTLGVPLDTLRQEDLSRVRVMIVTHYFGFPQAMRAISAFAREHGIAIVEDCAHAVFGNADGQAIGSWGEYACVSMMKFFPVYDGGCLASSRHRLDDLPLRPAPRRFEAKALFHSIESGLAYRRFPGLQSIARTVFACKDGLWRWVKQLRGPQTGPAAYREPAASEGVSGLDPAWLDRRISFASQQIVDRLPIARIIARRRANYARLEAALRDLPSARPLFGALPDGVVPYVFPLWVERPERVFVRLKTEGVPLFRWERLWDAEAARVDPLAARYATEIFQLPCHQDLTDDDLDWVIDRVQAAFAAAEAA